MDQRIEWFKLGCPVRHNGQTWFLKSFCGVLNGEETWLIESMSQPMMTKTNRKNSIFNVEMKVIKGPPEITMEIDSLATPPQRDWR